MTFAWPIALVSLIAIPLAFAGRRVLDRRRARYAVHFTNVEVLESVAVEHRDWRRPIAPAVFLLALAALALSLARPQVTRAVPDERATVVLVLDTSGSMLAKDVQPTRLGAAQDAVRTFLDKLPPRVRVALVSFSSVPIVAVPATRDHDLVRTSLNFTYPGGGTAIGDAIGRAIEVARKALGTTASEDGKVPAAIVLLSDGAQRTGRLAPVDAAALARQAGIRVYTVALGTPEGVVVIERGSFRRQISVPPDPETLKAVAETSGGTSYAVDNAEELSGVYRSLGSRLGRRNKPEEITFVFLASAAGLLLLSGGLSAVWAPKLP